MNYKIIIMLSLAVLSLVSCYDHSSENHDGHNHKEQTENATSEAHSEPITHTIYTEKTEVFVEFNPFVKNQTTELIIHLTKLGEEFKAVENGSLEIHLGEIKVIEFKMESLGIFVMKLKPTKTGKFPLKFVLKTNDYSDEIILENVNVFKNEAAATEIQVHSKEPELVFLKQQAWKMDFANEEIVAKDFYQVIKTSGEVMPAQGDEQTIVAKTTGILQWNTSSTVGNTVSRGNSMAKILSSGLTKNNFNTEYSNAKAAYDKAKTNYDKATLLVADQIISDIEFQDFKTDYFIAKANFESLGGSNFSSSKNISTPSSGYIKNILVSNGDFVEVGQPLAIISENKNLTLKTYLPQSKFGQINEINKANFKMAYSEEVFHTKELISAAKTLSKGEYQLPIYFKIDNIKDIISGSLAEVFLIGKKIENTITIPKSSLIEEQGNYFVFIQLSGEGFEKRNIEIGLSDGEDIQIISGLALGERVVTKGAFQLKLASMSGEIPVHSH